jgi:hypothetical protein
MENNILIKAKRYFPIVYAVLAIFVFFYVRNVLNANVVKIEERGEEKVVEDVKPVKISLEIKVNGIVQNKYESEMTTANSFDDLLEQLRKQGLVYESTSYLWGTEYENINRIQVPEGYSWKLYEGETNRTYKADDIVLKNKAVYTFSLEKEE